MVSPGLLSSCPWIWLHLPLPVLVALFRLMAWWANLPKSLLPRLAFPLKGFRYRLHVPHGQNMKKPIIGNSFQAFADEVYPFGITEIAEKPRVVTFIADSVPFKRWEPQLHQVDASSVNINPEMLAIWCLREAVSPFWHAIFPQDTPSLNCGVIIPRIRKFRVWWLHNKLEVGCNPPHMVLDLLVSYKKIFVC